MPKRKHLWNRIWNEIRSVRTLIIISILIAFVLPIVILRAVVLNAYQTKTMESRIIYVEGECNILASDILQYDFFNNNRSEIIRAELEEIAYMYNARIMIMDSSLMVVEDTYLFQQGKTLVSENALRALRGTTSGTYDRGSGYAKVYSPITDTNGLVRGVILVTLPDTGVRAILKYLDDLINVIIVVFSMISFAGAIVVSNFLIHPLHKMQVNIAKIADGDRETKLDHRTLTEYDELSNSVNVMLDKINVMDDSRQEFVSNVSHELKTPMTSMKVLAETLVNMEGAPIEMYQDFMKDIVREIDRENQIISDLLSMVKLDKTHAAMNIAATNINELVEQVLKRIRPIAQQKNVELIAESFRPVAAEIDEGKLSLAITNLVENAIKYNVDGGWVRVSVNADHKHFYIKVADSGIGIPSEAKEHVFERFYRVDKARSRATGGTGLGLAITKNVVLLHKGTIKLYSKENEGSTFIIRIPLNYVAGGQLL